MKDQPSQRPLLTEEKAKQVLKPHLDRIRGCFDRAWQAWEKLGQVAPDLRVPFDSSARAKFLSVHIRQNVEQDFSNVPNVRVIKKGALFMLEIEQIALLRFKKLGKNGKPSNIRTKQQVQLSLQLDIPGLPPASTHLVCGYIENKFSTDIEQCLITCSVGKERHYSIGLPQDKDNTIPMPIPETADLAPIVRLRQDNREIRKVE